MQQDMRSVVVSGALALVGLGLAAWAWKGDKGPEVRSGKVPFVACEQLDGLALEAGKRRVHVDFGSERAVVRLTRPTMQGALVRQLPGQATPTETLEMAANVRIQRLKERFSPGLARRALGQVAAARLPALGLDKSQEVLVVGCSDGERRFRVGSSSYGGGGRYVQALGEGGATGEVWLVDPTLVSDVRLADSRYVERRLVAAKRTALETAEVRALGKVRKLSQRNRKVLKEAEWVDSAAPDRRNELYGNWLAKVLRLRAISWLPKGVKPGQDQRPAVTTTPVVSVRLGGDASERVELVRGVGAKKQALFWARSGATGGWVSVSRTIGQQIADDVAVVVGAEAATPAKGLPGAATPTR